MAVNHRVVRSSRTAGAMDMQEDYDDVLKRLRNIEYLLRIQDRQEEANGVRSLIDSLLQHLASLTKS